MNYIKTFLNDPKDTRFIVLVIGILLGYLVGVITALTQVESYMKKGEIKTNSGETYVCFKKGEFINDGQR